MFTHAPQRAFALLDVLAAAAIGALLGWLLIALVHGAVTNAAHLDARLDAVAATDRLAERLTSDASGAWSVFVPADDALGAPNADGHELDFETENASRQRLRWAYAFDSAAKRVTEYAYAAGGAAVPGDTYDGVRTFSAAVYEAGDLARPSSPAYDPLFAGASIPAVDFDYGWGGGALGGNHLARVHLAAAGTDRTLVLGSGTAPSHFTIVVRYTPAPPQPTP